MRPFTSLTAILVSLGLTASLSAQTVATDPVGFTTLTVNAKPASIRGFTLLSLNLTRLPVFQSVVPTVSTNGSNQTVLTFPASTFTAGAFNAAANGGSHYIELLNGANSGRISDIVSNTDSTITLADNITSSLTAGSSTIKIRPNWTFGTVFGANNSAGLLGGVSASAADVVSLTNPSTGVATNYFYSTTNNRWQTGLTDATNHVIPADVGLRIERKLTSPVSFQIVGAVKLGTTGIFIQGGSAKNLNYVANPYPLPSVTLANSNLYTGNPATGLAGGVSASAADNLSIYDSATGVYTNYFYSTTNNRWQKGLADASNDVIPDGAAVLITRKNNGSSFIWYVPQPTMNLN